MAVRKIFYLLFFWALFAFGGRVASAAELPWFPGSVAWECPIPHAPPDPSWLYYQSLKADSASGRQEVVDWYKNQMAGSDWLLTSETTDNFFIGKPESGDPYELATKLVFQKGTQEARVSVSYCLKSQCVTPSCSMSEAACEQDRVSYSQQDNTSYEKIFNQGVVSCDIGFFKPLITLFLIGEAEPPKLLIKSNVSGANVYVTGPIFNGNCTTNTENQCYVEFSRTVKEKGDDISVVVQAAAAGYQEFVQKIKPVEENGDYIIEVNLILDKNTWEIVAISNAPNTNINLSLDQSGPSIGSCVTDNSKYNECSIFYTTNSVDSEELTRVYLTTSAKGYSSTQESFYLFRNELTKEVYIHLEKDFPSREENVCFEDTEICQKQNTIWKTYGIIIDTDLAANMDMVIEALNKLPEDFLNKCFLKKIVFCPLSSLGEYRYEWPPTAYLSTEYYDGDIESDNLLLYLRRAVIHEITHAYEWGYLTSIDFSDPGNYDIEGKALYERKPMNSWINATGWSFTDGKWILDEEKSTSPTEYGKRNPSEDMSESVSFYVYRNEELKESCPERYNFIKDGIFNGWVPGEESNAAAN